ncbi:MAG: c-type cytochrome [Burkholderiales bacterium]|nr:c-type cytochrome [Burkholderiales bacterium]
MSDNHTPEHGSPIKTPKQLIIVVLLAFIIPVLVIVMLAQMATSGKSPSENSAAAEEAIAQRLKPAGEVIVVAAGGAQEVRAGKAVYEAVCAACHTTGVLNAPKLGDKAGWVKLIAEGQSKLTADAMKGVRQMPPRGGAPDLSDVEFARAVAYLANQAGANWKEPDAPATPAAPAAVVAAAPATAAVPAAAANAGKGKSVYESSCTVCHAAGVAGAPKTGDKAAWASRLKTGNSALVAAVVKGKGAMPPKGGNMSLSDDDIQAAVDYMLSLVK